MILCLQNSFRFTCKKVQEIIPQTTDKHKSVDVGSSVCLFMNYNPRQTL